ncbi:hypothetical protein WICPIJ_000642 [Wickerhamomyces pijperi]|uniref:Uncharacterized protein n=1 Tax=Wickerhamomyces pijperi TaxID=599730 RepID=A0A9P8QGF3_WICPI|nr:hypothetical protein WICPIJ_000642 [Wickerhamomyces pijperi]
MKIKSAEMVKQVVTKVGDLVSSLNGETVNLSEVEMISDGINNLGNFSDDGLFLDNLTLVVELQKLCCTLSVGESDDVLLGMAVGQRETFHLFELLDKLPLLVVVIDENRAFRSDNHQPTGKLPEPLDELVLSQLVATVAAYNLLYFKSLGLLFHLCWVHIDDSNSAIVTASSGNQLVVFDIQPPNVSTVMQLQSQISNQFSLFLIDIPDSGSQILRDRDQVLPSVVELQVPNSRRVTPGGTQQFTGLEVP